MGGEVSADGKVESRKTCKIRAGQVVSFGDIRRRAKGQRAKKGQGSNPAL